MQMTFARWNPGPMPIFFLRVKRLRPNFLNLRPKDRFLNVRRPRARLNMIYSRKKTRNESDVYVFLCKVSVRRMRGV